MLYWQKDDVRMHEVMRLAHAFLQSFCLGNHSNQALMHQSLEMFLVPGVSVSYSVCRLVFFGSFYLKV